MQSRLVAATIWVVLIALVIVPLLIASTSPYLASRDTAYIVAGFAGIVALGLFLLQPLFAAGYLRGVSPAQARKWHRRIGAAISICVVLHIAGLYLTSPPDTIDALLLASPTPFSIFGVVAMWGIIITVFLVVARKRLRLRYPAWQVTHKALAFIMVLSTVIHALQIDGTMGLVSKWVLCVAVLMAAVIAIVDVRFVRPAKTTRKHASNIG